MNKKIKYYQNKHLQWHGAPKKDSNQKFIWWPQFMTSNSKYLKKGKNGLKSFFCAWTNKKHLQLLRFLWSLKQKKFFLVWIIFKIKIWMDDSLPMQCLCCEVMLVEYCVMLTMMGGQEVCRSTHQRLSPPCWRILHIPASTLPWDTGRGQRRCRNRNYGKFQVCLYFYIKILLSNNAKC